MRQRVIVSVSAWIEVIAGALFLIAPGLSSRLVFGSTPEAVGMPLGRFAGLGLLALGVVCLHARNAESRDVVRDLFGFNVGVVLVFAISAVTRGRFGVLLWPAVILHAAIAVAMLPHVRTGRARSGESGEREPKRREAAEPAS